MNQYQDPGKVVIIGCGPTGLGAACRFLQQGFDNFILIDAASKPGGLAASYCDTAGFWWDLGGHVQFSHYSYYDRMLDTVIPEGWLWHNRESWIWLKDRFVPYPFQYNIHRLDPNDQTCVLAGLRWAETEIQTAKPPKNFREWLIQTFGAGLADIFLMPYNLKVWAWPPEKMAWNWIGERVAVPDLGRIERNIRDACDDVSWGPNNKFRFPLHRGTGAIWQAVAAAIPQKRFFFNQQVNKIDTHTQTIHTNKGSIFQYDTLISTMPLDVLIARTQPLCPELKLAGKKMCHNSTHVLGLGLRNGRPKALQKKCWIYFPEEHSPYYRVTVFSNYSPNNVPPGDGIWSLMAEVSESFYKTVNTTNLREWTLSALRKDKLLEPDTELLSFWHKRLEYGYPIPFLERDELLNSIMPQLEQERIFSRGRFGGWKYEVGNQDHSFMQGVELVNFLLSGEPETTFPDPQRANSGEFLKEKVLLNSR